jgi:hypothetical protein
MNGWLVGFEDGNGAQSVDMRDDAGIGAGSAPNFAAPGSAGLRVGLSLQIGTWAHCHDLPTR